MLLLRERWLLLLCLVPLWTMAAFTVMPQRYLLWSTPLIILPLGLLAARAGKIAAGALMTAALIGLQLHPKLLQQTENYGLANLQQLRNSVTSSDQIMDCTPKRYGMILLPEFAASVLHEGQPNVRPFQGPRSCLLQKHHQNSGP